MADPHFLAAPSVVAALLISMRWISQQMSTSCSEILLLGLKWVWPPPNADSLIIISRRPLGRKQWLLVLLLWPIALVSVPIQYALSVLDRVGFHLVWDRMPYSLNAYCDAQGLLEMLMRSIPQIILQSAVYILGSSRATGIYIDETIFIPSIVLTLTSVLFQIAHTLWQSLSAAEPLWVFVLERFTAMTRLYIIAPSAAQRPKYVRGLIRI